MKTCSGCKAPNGPRAGKCSKCLKPFPGYVAKPTVIPTAKKPKTTKPAATPATLTSRGTVVDLVEALFLAKSRLNEFEPNDDIDGAKAYIDRALAITKSLHRA